MIEKNKILFITHSSLISGGAEQDFDGILEHFASSKEKYEILSLFPEGERADGYKRISDFWAVYRHCFLPLKRRPLREYIQFLFSYFEQKKILKKLLGSSKVDSCFINVSVLVWFVFLLGKYTNNIVLLFREKIEPGFLRRLIYKVYCKRVKTVLFVSENLMNEFVAVTGRTNNLDIFRARMRLEKREFMNVKHDYEELGGVKGNNDVMRLICSGTVSTVKNQILILRALKEIKEKNFAVPFVTFAGDFNTDPAYKKILDRYISDYDLSGFVAFTGHLDREKYTVQLNQSDVLVVSSVTEGLPLVIIEALATGKAVISTSVGSIGDIIKDNYNGLLIGNNEKELAEAILKLAGDAALREKLSSNGFETYLEYEREQKLSVYMLESYLSISPGKR
ncbi:MAG: glycosyltransferase family 4 protein [Bacteroidetes bacterium]|nr:glycosyltransferase family 4 protein [Bacteroidota bacterium]